MYVLAALAKMARSHRPDRCYRQRRDIIAVFRNNYENVEEFERRHGVKLPEDIAAMLTQG